uniref:Ribosomal protein L16 n=1 Tax=Ulva sp. UNA00071828 TaxID=1641711 RepID=A0A0F6ZDC3_9CHLO|nr:ribosomal protein L16 [Ulva sp. UNA00071828]
MGTIPKRLAFKLYFREKTKTRKLIYRQRRLRQLSKNSNAVFLQLPSYKPTSKPLEKITDPYLLTLNGSPYYNSKNDLQILKQSNNFVCGFYSKQKSDPLGSVWLINTNHVYLKTQTHCSVSSKKLLFGLYGICVVQYATISAAYIETIKLDIAKILKKKGRVWTRICCDCPVSSRPAETRMGKGKGSISHWVAKVRPGQLLFEFSGITKTQLNDIFQKLCKKTSIGLSIVS